MLLLLPKHTKNPCVGPGPTLAFVFEMGEPLEDFEETEKGDVTKAMRNKGRSRWWPDRSRWSTVRAELMGVGGGPQGGQRWKIKDLSMCQTCPVHLSAKWSVTDINYPPKECRYPDSGPVRWHFIAAFSRWETQGGRSGQTLEISEPDDCGVRAQG